MAFTRQLARMVAVALFSSAQAGTVRYVDDDAPLGGDGLSWDTAYRYLQDALTEAAGDPGVDEIEFFSSRGPCTIRFPEAEIRDKPQLAGVDGITKLRASTRSTASSPSCART